MNGNGEKCTEDGSKFGFKSDEMIARRARYKEFLRFPNSLIHVSVVTE